MHNQARPIRRERILDVLILQQKLIEDPGFIKGDGICFEDDAGQNLLEMSSSSGIIDSILKPVLNCNAAEDWLELRAIKIDKAWLIGCFKEAQKQWIVQRSRG